MRWKPRFSVRMMVVVMTFVCAYAACWGPTKTQGVADLHDPSVTRAVDAWMPLVVKTEEDAATTGAMERYYFWCFGFVAKLPYERELPVSQLYADDLRALNGQWELISEVLEEPTSGGDF